MTTFIKNITDDFYRLGSLEKFAISATIILITILVITTWKQSTESFDLAGKAGDLQPYLHHSRWGALISLIGGFLVLKYKKGPIELLGFLLIITGLTLVIQHLATEQCFAVFTSAGRVAGAFC